MLPKSQRSGGNGQDASMPLETPFDLTLYTAAYKQLGTSAEAFRTSDDAWTRFLAARPLLYLPDRSPNTDNDPIDTRWRLWTRRELQNFGDEVERRTQTQLLAQERTLRRWHSSAMQVQRCFRGMQDRRLVLLLRQAQFENVASLERAMKLARQHRRQYEAAVAIQRTFRRHRKLVNWRQRVELVLQRARSLFMLRLQRWRARVTMQRAARCYIWRMRWRRHSQLVKKMLKAAARHEQLALTVDSFQRTRETTRRQQQAATWAAHPERLQMLLRVRRRKREVQDAAVGLPSLLAPKSHACSGKAVIVNKTKPKRTSQQLPVLRQTSRGE